MDSVLDVGPLKDWSLLQPLQDLTSRTLFLSSLFDIDLSVEEVRQTDNAYGSFFAHYNALSILAVNRNQEVENVTHAQILKILVLLKNPVWTKEDLIGKIIKDHQSSVDVGFAECLLDLGASLWSLAAIGRFPGVISYDEPTVWRDGKLFVPASEPAKANGVIGRLFPGTHAPNESVRLPQSFTASHLEQIGGIQIRWTSNLADHLLLRDDDTKLMLFHQVSALRLHKSSPNSPFSPTFVDETLRTISLLIPPILGAPNPWFQSEQERWRLDQEAGLCDRLNSSERQIDRFYYWRDRLVLVKRTFDEAEPRSVKQLWWDDRRKSQWFTFWVAVLVFVTTVFFGVIQSIASIVQAWASVKALKS
ncbi:MAG: hypothetical protein Q9190_000958 [Brigantiaea leucoxantha]